MTNISVKQMPAFKKAYKKLRANKKSAIDDAIGTIIHDPKIGEEKKGDLAGIFVYKFRVHHQEWLWAYIWSPKERLLLALGVHENFYGNLKRGHPINREN